MPFTVATYNVLADSYIKPEYFPRTPSMYLDPTWRHPALALRIVRLGADVVGFQEMEPVALGHVERALGPLGYRCHFARKGRGRPDGCALAVRESALLTLAVHSFEYDDGDADRPASGHLALLGVFEQEGRRFGVATTHVKWDPPDLPGPQRYGARQVPLLLERIERVEPACATWVVCGDFNAEAANPVLEPFVRRGFLDAYRDRPDAFTANANRRARRIDFLFHTPDLAAHPANVLPLNNDTSLPTMAEPSDHLPISATFRWATA